MANMSAKFDQEAYNGSVAIVFTKVVSVYVHCDLNL